MKSLKREIEELLPTHKNKAIASALNCSLLYVRQIRYLSGIKTPKASWSDFEHLLGVLPDEEIAKMKGIKKNSVTTHRMRVGVGAIKQGEEEILQNKYFLKMKEKSTMFVRCAFGIIDILSDDAIYEFKINLDSNSAKTAIGQLLVYSLLYKDRRKVIVTNNSRISTAMSNAISGMGIEIVVFDPQKD